MGRVNRNGTGWQIAPAALRLWREIGELRLWRGMGNGPVARDQNVKWMERGKWNETEWRIVPAVWES
jgi:hypothetical protein